MKTLLICPSANPAVSLLGEPGPLATIPVFGESIVSHWIEHLAALGARQVEIIASNGADQVRQDVGDGARWGVRVNVVASNYEFTRKEAADRYQLKDQQGWLPAPLDIVAMSHLPGCPELPLFESYSSWFAAVIAWMPRALTPARVRVLQARPGIWIGSRARISAKAELIGPCWIGDQVSVGDGAIVGPGAVLEDRTFVDEKALVTQSWVASDTFIGPMTSVANSLAWGSTLINWQTDSSLNVPDPFLLSALARHQPPVPNRRPWGAASARERSRTHLSVFAALRARLDRGPT